MLDSIAFNHVGSFHFKFSSHSQNFKLWKNLCKPAKQVKNSSRRWRFFSKMFNKKISSRKYHQNQVYHQIGDSIRRHKVLKCKFLHRISRRMLQILLQSIYDQQRFVRNDERGRRNDLKWERRIENWISKFKIGIAKGRRQSKSINQQSDDWWFYQMDLCKLNKNVSRQKALTTYYIRFQL